jgi:hypothetical protein
MTVEDEILKEMREQTRYMKAQLGVLAEIKFELQNSRKLSESTFKIKIRESWFDRVKMILRRD